MKYLRYVFALIVICFAIFVYLVGKKTFIYNASISDSTKYAAFMVILFVVAVIISFIWTRVRRKED